MIITLLVDKPLQNPIAIPQCLEYSKIRIDYYCSDAFGEHEMFMCREGDYLEILFLNRHPGRISAFGILE